MTPTPTAESLKRMFDFAIKFNSKEFDAIQDILTKKETSFDINLDIEYKIHSALHGALVTLIKIAEERL